MGKNNRRFIFFLRSRRQVVAFLFVMILLGSCSLKWWYEQSDWIMLWRIDLYFDLDRNQSNKVESRLKDLLHQHRKQIVPEHLKFLRGIQERAGDKLSDQEIKWFLEEVQRQYQLIVQHIVHDVALFYSSLTPEQINYYEKEVLKDNEKHEEILRLSVDERQQKKAERTTETLSDWFGGFSDEQEKLIKQQLVTLPDTYEEWYSQRLDRQRIFLLYLREQKGPQILENTLRGWFLNKTFFRFMDNPNMIKVFHNIDDLVTAQQRKHFLDKVQTWIDDFSALTNQK